MKPARLGPAAAAPPARQHPRPALAVILVVLAVVALDAMLPLTLAAPETCTPVLIDDFSHGNVLNSVPWTPNSVGGTALSNTVCPVADNHLEVPSTSSWSYLRENLPCVDVTAFTGVSFTFKSTVGTTPALAPNRLIQTGYSDLASCNDAGSTQFGISVTLNNLSNYRQSDASFFIPRSAWFGGRDVQFLKMMALYFDARSPAVVGPIWFECSVPQAVNTTTTLSATTSSESLTTLTTSSTANSDLSSTEPAATTTSTTTDLLTTSGTTGSTDSSTAASTSNTVSETSSAVLSTADLLTASSTDTTSTTADLSTMSSTSTSFPTLATSATSSATTESLPTSTTLSTSFSVPSATVLPTNSSATSATAAVSGSLASTTVSTLSTAPGTTATTGTAQTSSAAVPVTASTTASAYSTTTIRASANTTTSFGTSTTSTRAPATASLSLTSTTVKTGTRPCQSKPTLIVPPFWSTPARPSVPPSSPATTSAPRASVSPARPVTITLSAPPVAPGFTLSMSTKTVTAFQSPVVVIVPVAVPRVTVQPDRSRPAPLVKYDVDITAAAVSLPSAPETATTASFDAAVPAAIAVAVVGAAVAAAVVVQRRRRNGSANLRAGEAGYGMVAVSGIWNDAETMVVTN